MTNTPSFHHEAAQAQLNRADALAKALSGRVVVRSHHTSKSITLPVPTILLPGLSFTFRDNFHDLNLLAESEKEMDLPLSFFYEPKSFDWYEETIKSKRGYSFRGWTDDEMNDPRILRVKVKNASGYEYWYEVKGEAKGRWSERATSTAWYEHDWSSGKLIAVGPSDPFGAGTTFYASPTAHSQGIETSAKPYTGPCKSFLNCVGNWDALVRICHGIAEAVK